MTKRIAQAWAFAAILLLPNYIDLTSSAGDARMRSPVPLTRIALAHLADMAIVTVLFAAIMALSRLLPAWPKIRWGLLALLPVLLFVRNLDLIPFAIPWPAIFAASLLWWSLLLLLLLRGPEAAQKLRTAGSTLLAAFAIFAFIMTWQLTRATLWRPGPQSFASSLPLVSAKKPRLVWIVFDELSYKYTFESRDPSLHLPNFDRLRNESVLYTNMAPIAYRTTRVVPSLLLGRAVTDVAYTSSNRYLVQIGEDSHWIPFEAGASLFGIAKDRGLTTSIVGWYIAYCPIFTGIANDCYWGNEDAQDRGPTLQTASFAANVWFPLRIMAEQAVAPRRAWTDDAELNSIGHIASVQNIQQHALHTLSTSSADLLYLHLPAPHPVAFWNRHTGKFALGGSYLDSLDYSDRLLGQMLDILSAQPRWANTMLIVQGDHSWRTQMWRPLPGWSAEDERISDGGQWDPRPLLMIHTPSQHDAKTINTPTSLMYVHDTVAATIGELAQ
jgi:hypothetical protein